MKNKKNIAMAMAAVSTLGAVAPAFADGVQGRAVITSNVATIDARLASGYEVVEKTAGTAKVFTRAEIFNYNGDAKDRDKHTLKSNYANHVILAQKLDDQDPAEDVFVLGKKISGSKVEEEKSKIEVLKLEIAEHFKKGYSFTETPISAELDAENKTYTTGSKTFVLTDKTDDSNKITITVNKVDKIEVADKTEEEKEIAKANELRKSVFGETTKTDESFDFDKKASTPANYSDVNSLKYKIESNIAKFDIVKDEDDTHTGLVVTLYAKGATKVDANIVKTIEFKNTKQVDNKKIISIPQTNDFTGHWAQKEIVEAMLAGQVDASENFRPQDGIKRGEFAKIVCTVFGLKVDETATEPFHDVNNGDWYQKYVATLYNTKTQDGASVVQGDGENFRPEDTITREEVAVILSKMVSKVDKEEGPTVNGEKIHEIVDTGFEDTKDIAAWADHSVKYLKYKNVVQGNEGKFNPKQNITRAESIVMVQRAKAAK